MLEEIQPHWKTRKKLLKMDFDLDFEGMPALLWQIFHKCLPWGMSETLPQCINDIIWRTMLIQFHKAICDSEFHQCSEGEGHGDMRSWNGWGQESCQDERLWAARRESSKINYEAREGLPFQTRTRFKAEVCKTLLPTRAARRLTGEGGSGSWRARRGTATPRVAPCLSISL